MSSEKWFRRSIPACSCGSPCRCGCKPCRICRRLDVQFWRKTAADTKAKARRAAVLVEMRAERWTKAESRFTFGRYDRLRDNDPIPGRVFGERPSKSARGKQAKRNRRGAK